MIPVTTLASFPWWAESPMWTTSMCRTGCPVPRSHMPSYAYLLQDCHTECIRLSSQIYWSCLWNHPALVESWWNLVPWIIQMEEFSKSHGSIGSSMAMIMVCKNFRIQIIQIYSDDFRWQCWLQSCGSPWFSPIKKRLNWWIERRLGWGWCEDRRDQCRSRSAEWRWSLGFLWISGGSQRLEKQTIDSIDEHRWK